MCAATAITARADATISSPIIAGSTPLPPHGWGDLNQRAAREWCDKVNATYKKHLRAVPRGSCSPSSGCI